MSKHIQKELNCKCGKCSFKIIGKPILTATCYCKSCQKAGANFLKLNNMQSPIESDGGTSYIIQKKTDITLSKGAEHLGEYKLTETSPTRRILATCCNTPMFLEFNQGHWLSLYLKSFNEKDQPRIDMRTMTVDKPEGTIFSDDIPSPKTHNFSFMWKLLTAWVSMGFKNPKIDYIKKTIEIK